MTYIRKNLIEVAFILIIVSSILLQRWDLLPFATPLILMLYFSSRYHHPTPRDFKITRIVSSKRAIQGERMNVRVTIENVSSERFFLKIEDTLPDVFTVVEGTNKKTIVLGPYDSVTLSYNIKTNKRGHYKIGPVNITSMDSLFLDTKTITIDNSASIAVFPKVVHVPHMLLKSRVTGKWPGEVISKEAGRGTEFLEIREYVPGDELRFINWKATARKRKLMTNKYALEKIADVLLVIDVPESRLVGKDKLEKLIDVYASYAASISYDLLIRGNRLSLLVIGGYRDWIKPGFGKKHLLAILHTLAELKYSPIKQDVDFMDVFRHIIPYLSPIGSQVIFISSFTEEYAFRVLEEANRLSFKVMCIAVNPFRVIRRYIETKYPIDPLANLWRIGVTALLKGKCDLHIWEREIV